MDAQFHQRAFDAGPQQHAMQLAAMHHRIRVAETLAERRIERDFGDPFIRHRVHQPQAVDINRLGPGVIADAERVEAVEGVRADLDACADLAQLRRLFEHETLSADAGQPKRRAKTADAATGDQDGEFAGHRSPLA